MVFKATFNNISVILWQSVLLVEETEVPRENHRPAARMMSDTGNYQSVWRQAHYNVYR
jgi:hypothetical protein